MYYSKILAADIINSINGFTCSLFVSGCNRKCKGCFNPEAWNPCFGKLFDDKAKELIFNELSKPYNKAFSILGGDPMSYLSDNRKVIIALCKEIKEKFPSKTIYMWTGYTLEEIQNDESMKDILNYIDILIDGPFIEEEYSCDLVLKGSKNQRVIDLRKEKQI